MSILSKLRQSAFDLLAAAGIAKPIISTFLKNESFIPPLKKPVAIYLKDLAEVANRKGALNFSAG